MNSRNADTCSKLQSWFLEQGGRLHPNIKIEPTANGNGFHATGPIQPGEELAHAPHSITLSYLNALVDEEYRVFKQQRHHFKVEAIGFWYLMAQYTNRERSFWKPYLDALPSPESDLTQPLFFEDPEDLAFLAGTDAWYTAQARKAVYEQYYETGLQILKDAGINVEPYTWRLFRWAVAMFTSRSFISRSIHPTEDWKAYKTATSGHRVATILDMSDVPAEDLIFGVLWPGLDAANHNPESKVDWTFSNDRYSISLAKIATHIELGSEVFNNYGQKGNGELLLGYGFCIADNPHDTVGVTPKRPGSELEEDLKVAQRDYFTSEGNWSVEKTTYQLQRPRDPPDPWAVCSLKWGLEIREASDTWAPVSILPEPLLELLLYIVRHSRGESFLVEKHALDYLTESSSCGRKYAPHIARMIFTYISHKLNALKAGQPHENPYTAKQIYASMYRESQMMICADYARILKGFVRSLVWPNNEHSSLRAVKVRLLDLRTLHNILYGNGTIDDDFLDGIETNTNSRDFDTLWFAGWEEDLFVLLLCFTLLSPSLQSSEATWQREALGDYTPHVDSQVSQSQSQSEGEGDPQALEKAQELLGFVRHAADVCGKTSVWGDDRWSVEFIQRVGRQAIERDSFQLMHEIPEAAREEAGGAQEMMRCYICLYLAKLT